MVAGIFVPARGPHGQGISLIRDAEIENTIRTYATPVFRVAGLDPSHVRIYLVNDRSLNAFVAGGQRLFINTGLLLRSDNANQIIGIIAHETGHIAGGHLSRVQSALAKNSVPVILSYILGGAAVIATGRGDIGSAIIAGGQTIALRNFLSYSRTQEASADQAAMKFLDATEQSANGLLDFMRHLSDQELLSATRQDAYVRSHPPTEKRISTIAAHVASSPYSDTPDRPEYQVMFERMTAKLYAFKNPFGATMHRYKESDESIGSRYARAVAYYRKPDMAKALSLIDGLINEHPNDPYFHELKGQMLFDNGWASDALVSYQRAAFLLPNSHLIRRDLARVQLEAKDLALLDSAIRNLTASLAIERFSSFTWRQLAIAYGRKGDKGRRSLALAEEALLINKPDIARYHAGFAEQIFTEGEREWLQARDIQLAANELENAIKRRHSSGN